MQERDKAARSLDQCPDADPLPSRPVRSQILADPGNGTRGSSRTGRAACDHDHDPDYRGRTTAWLRDRPKARRGWKRDTTQRYDATEVTGDIMRAIFDANVFGMVWVTHAFLPPMLRSPAPVVVNLSGGLDRWCGRLSAETELAIPAAYASPPDRTTTACRTASAAVAGGSITAHVDPSKCMICGPICAPS